MAMTPTPSRATGEQDLNQWNQALRSSPEYMEFFQAIGVDPRGKVHLSEQQQGQFEKFLANKGIQIPQGMHIDPAGNLNQKNTLWKNVGVGAAIGGAALSGLGAAGIGPLSGLLGGAAAGGSGLAAGESGVIAGTGIPAVGGTGAVGLGSSLGTAGTFGKLASGLKNADTITDIGRGIGAMGDAAAQNRGQALGADETAAGIDAHNLDTWRNAVLAREAEGRASGTDARKNLQYGEYLKGGGSEYTPKNGLPSYGFGPHATTEAEQAGGSALADTARQRLEQGNPVPEFRQPLPFSSDARNPGGLERFSNYASPALSIFGKLAKRIL